MIQLKNKTNKKKFYKTQPYKYSTHVQVQAQKKVWKYILRLLRYITSGEINHVCIHKFSNSSVAQSCSTLRPHESKHPRPLCPLPTPGVHPNSRPSSRWCHPTISSSVVSFSSYPQSFPESGSFQMSQLYASDGQSIGSFSFNISPSNEYPGLIPFRMDWLDLLAV